MKHNRTWLGDGGLMHAAGTVCPHITYFCCCIDYSVILHVGATRISSNRVGGETRKLAFRLMFKRFKTIFIDHHRTFEIEE
jgi:hypothetical protein